MDIYIERDALMEEPTKKYSRLFQGNEMRLRKTYYAKCWENEKDGNGKATVNECSCDTGTKGGKSVEKKKRKGPMQLVT